MLTRVAKRKISYKVPTAILVAASISYAVHFGVSNVHRQFTTINQRLDSVISKLENKNEELSKEIEKLQLEKSNLEKEFKTLRDQQNKNRITLEKISRGGFDMRATAYDLSVKSCGKKSNHSEYGITRTGTKATKGRTVAVDPNVIPLGSKLHIAFPQKYNYLNGMYVAEDTGNLVKGKTVDIFLGENEPEADIFGVQKVTVHILRRGWGEKNDG